jgi:hypothetical protein
MKALLFRSLAFAALLTVNLSASAQTFAPPAAYNNVYPGSSSLILRPETSSSYSIGNTNSPYGTAALYLAGWSGFAGANGFSWRFTNPANPAALFAQGIFSYPNGRDIEVGLVDGSGGPQILVAYYRVGAGHMLDVYNVFPFVSFAYTLPLSASPIYGRISMDCHLTYGVAIVWDNPANNAIEAIAGQNGTWGPVTALPPHPTGASSEVPDVAFSHSNGPLNIHIVTHTPAANELTEAVISWPDLLVGSLASYAVQDNNFIPVPNVPVRPVINCPDHFNAENWGYTYTLDDNQIEVRFIDYNTLATPITQTVNSGGAPLGNVGTVGVYRNRMPSIAHNNNGDMYIAWYAAGSLATSSSQYIAMNITADGNTLLSAPDYMLVPNSTTSSPYPLAPGISLSKMNDLNPQYLYAAYYDLNSAVGYAMHHAWHIWPNAVFKGTGSNANQWLASHPECSGQTTNATSLAARVSVRVSPNPFTEVVHAAFTTEKSGTAILQLTDITGKVVDQTQHLVEKGAQSFNTGSLKNLAAGTYLLNISVDGTRIGQQKVVKL